MVRGILLVITIGSLGLGLVACGDSSPPDNTVSTALEAAPPALPPPPPPGAFLAQLSPAQTNQLRQLGVDVVVPGAVPPEFSVAELNIASAADRAPAYAIVYRNRASQCFAIEFTAGSVPDSPATDSRRPINPPLFVAADYGLNYGAYKRPELKAQFPKGAFFSDWLRGGAGAYRLVGASIINQTYETLSGCDDIPLDQAVAIVESLTVLSPDQVGDGESLK